MPPGEPAAGTHTGTTVEFRRLALDAYEAGQHDRAEAILAQIVEQLPQDAAAWHLRGINIAAAGDLVVATRYFLNAVTCDNENPKYCAALAEHLMRRSMDHAAVEPWQRTTDLAPDNADYQMGFAMCLTRLDRHADALPHYAKAATLDPNSEERKIAHGVALSNAGAHNEAIEILHAAVLSKPWDAEILFRLGSAQQQGEQLTDAIDTYRAALDENPDLIAARLNLSACLRELGDFDGAIRQCHAVLDRDRDSVGAMNNLGAALCAEGRNKEAIAQYRNALFHEPENLTALLNMGVALHAEGDFSDAEEHFRKCLILKPNWHEAQRSLANLLQSRGSLAEAVALYQAVIDSRPLDFKSYGKLGLALLNLNKPYEAISVYEKALALAPGRAELQTDFGIAQLLTGDFENGWLNYAARQRMAHITTWRPGHGMPEWQGERDAREGSDRPTVLVHAEQGFSDTLQFCRYIPLLADGGVSVMFECQAALRPLLDTLCPDDADKVPSLIVPTDPLPDADYQVPLLNLPKIFKTGLDSIPAQVPYLAAPADRRQKWSDLETEGAFSVGIVYESNPNRQDDYLRSCPLEALAPIDAISGVRLFSLQKGTPQTRYPDMRNLGPDLDDFADTAAIVEQLDLVISVDTAVAHLAGALGQPVWVMLGYAADWRYLLDREDSPWYPTMRLFRQPEYGDWNAVTLRIAEALKRLVRERQMRSHTASTKI